MNIGNAIRFLRKQKGYTQAQLADFSHTTKSTISNLESGNQGYSSALLQHLAKALDCPISKIFFIAEQMDSEAIDANVPLDKLPIDILFNSLSPDVQMAIHHLIKQMVIERQKNQS